MVEALVEAFERNGIREIAVLDPIFNAGDHATAVLERFASKGYRGTLSLQCRAEMIDDELLECQELLTADGLHVLAHPALVRFILRAQSDGKRLVLVITGKGRPGDEAVLYPTPRGILRRQVPHWLDIPPLAQAVLQVTPAHIRHGGDGAFYVYLKRGR